MSLAHGQNGAARRHQYQTHQPSTSTQHPHHHFTSPPQQQQQQHPHQQHPPHQQHQHQQHHQHQHHQSNNPLTWASAFHYHRDNNLNTIDKYTYSTLSQQPEQRFQQLRLSNPDSMQSDTNWHLANGYHTPTSTTHHRQPSQTSSAGSISGPASPFHPASTSANPRIALSSDPVGEDDSAYYVPSHTFQKALPTPQSTPLRETFIPSEYQEYHNQIPFDAEAVFADIMSLPHKSNNHDESMRAPDLTRSSGTSMNDSPATPADEGEEQKAKQDYSRTIPKLDRTMSDVYNDELYSPSFPVTSTPASMTTTTSPQSDVFAQRLRAANTHHLNASEASPMAPSRNRSPFRQGSPLAPAGDSFGPAVQVAPPPMRIGSAAQMRQKQKAEHDAHVLRQQIQKLSPGQATPRTISPKDALLEYHESEEDARTPLFPPQQATPTIKAEPRAETSLTNPQQPDVEETASQQSFRSMATTRRESSSLSNASSSTQQPSSSFTFVPPSVPGGVQVPQQYPFISQSSRQTSSLSDRTPDFPATLRSMESTTSSDYVPDSEVTKPVRTAADGGTYTCTYHGCTLRFETPAKLQKHKREGHRQSAPLIGGVQSSGNSSDGGSATGNGMTSAALLRNSQAGPHKCERINPSTGKPCNTIFSRPYDLTRHEDTIHNARKQKVRCELCTEEKTFSRNDALTRHMKVVHPEVPWPAGKSRRRNGES